MDTNRLEENDGERLVDKIYDDVERNREEMEAAAARSRRENGEDLATEDVKVSYADSDAGEWFRNANRVLRSGLIILALLVLFFVVAG